jgi:hypothetical protein
VKPNPRDACRRNRKSTSAVSIGIKVVGHDTELYDPTGLFKKRQATMGMTTTVQKHLFATLEN